jgi:SAM-dependent methyltransferase
MSDGPSKVVPAEPLDDIILGDDDNTATDPPPPARARPSAPPPLRSSVRPPDRPSGAPSAAPSTPSASVPPPPQRRLTPSARPAESARGSESHGYDGMATVAAEAGKDPKESSGRKRAKMTLRIPDDEISRPQIPVATPAGGVPIASAHVEERELPMAYTGPPPPQRAVGYSADDTLELPQDETRARLNALTAAGGLKAVAAAGIDPGNEPGWTPFQPHVADQHQMEAQALVPIQPTPIIDVNGSVDELLDDDPHEDRTIVEHRAPLYGLDPQDPQAHARDTQHDNGLGTDAVNHTTHSQPPISEEIPVEMDLSEVPDPSSDELATSPRGFPIALDSEEIRIEESDRAGETGEVEVAVEDLVSVESLPSPAHPGMKAGYHPAFVAEPTPAPGPSATSLMQGVAPPASPSRPAVTTPHAPAVTPQPSDAYHPPYQAQAVAQPVAYPSSPAPASPAAQHTAVVQASQGQTAARRQSNPLIFVPPVGALAPPAMTDAAAHRKKTRPWWEELFNDDFIRTMAKVTEVQIGKEVNFIEESLGCEAGAMILDLACGTGRHAVELAARGYQVVGFDLSLAMLARASDEAQDRRQKINFVQGDMREMTFEETFDGVYSWNTSFGYFDEEKNGAVIARVHKALKKGGQFLLDVVNRDYIVRQAPSLAWFEGDGCICMDEMTIDFITSRMKVKRTLMMDDGRTKEIEYSIRTYALHELGKMLHDNGFRVAEVSGRTGTPGVFFGCESPRTLILAEKR